MVEKFWLTLIPQESSLARELAGLAEIYHELDTQCENWRQISPYLCPPGCGVCCTRFIPDVLPVEALFTAGYLLLNLKKYQTKIDNKAGANAQGCCFYEPELALHCTIYPARPLICRLFAYSALSNKDGKPEYKPCTHMQSRETPGLAAAVPPLMTVFSHRIAALEPSLSGERLLLPEQLIPAIQKISLIRKFNEDCLSEQEPT